MKLGVIAAGIAIIVALPVVMANGSFEFSITDIKGDVSESSIDITKAWTTVDGSNLVFHLQVAGNINTNGAFYTFEFNDGSNDVGVVYSNNFSYYSGISSGGLPSFNVNGNTLTITVPYAAFTAGLNAATTSFKVAAQFNGEADYAGYENNGGGGNSGNEGNENNDPTTETPTDTSINVKINSVKYKFQPVGSNSIKAYIYIDGTTNGVHHVELNFVVYYKNGTHDYGSWIEPVEFNGSYGGYSVNIFFNSTEGSWNKWKFEMNATYPMTQYDWLYDVMKGKSEVSKFTILARAYKDEAKQNWNQYKYDTTPSFSGDFVTYGISTNNNGGGTNNEKSKGTPGFEMVLVIASLLLLSAEIKRRKK